MPPGTAQAQVAMLLRRYLAGEGQQADRDWEQLDEGLHLAGLRDVLCGLDNGDLPSHGDPLAVVELAWRGLQAKHRAFSRHESIYLDSPDVLDSMAAVMRRWPSIRFERGGFAELWPDQYRAWRRLGHHLKTRQAAALDGVRAKLRYELEMRDLALEQESETGPEGRDLLVQSIEILDRACPDPMRRLGYRLAAQRRGNGRPSGEIADLERQAQALHATTPEGALAHLLLARARLEAADDLGAGDLDSCRRHIDRACRVLEAHTGLPGEELGGAPTAPLEEELSLEPGLGNPGKVAGSQG